MNKLLTFFIFFSTSFCNIFCSNDGRISLCSSSNSIFFCNIFFCDNSSSSIFLCSNGNSSIFLYNSGNSIFFCRSSDGVFFAKVVVVVFFIRVVVMFFFAKVVVFFLQSIFSSFCNKDYILIFIFDRKINLWSNHAKIYFWF